MSINALLEGTPAKNDEIGLKCSSWRLERSGGGGDLGGGGAAGVAGGEAGATVGERGGFAETMHCLRVDMGVDVSGMRKFFG